MNAHETACQHNMGETCVSSLRLDELMRLAGRTNSIFDDLGSMTLTYGAIEGSERLRRAIASLYMARSAGDVLVTHGAIGANALLYQALIEPGDEVVSLVPAYQQHYAIPESLGARVKRLQLRWENRHLPDIGEFEDLVTRGTRLIVMTNPNNPTGARIDDGTLRRIADIAAKNDSWVLCDEVYRGVAPDETVLPLSIADIYGKGIAVGSMSKAFALAGLRLGWILAPPRFCAG